MLTTCDLRASRTPAVPAAREHTVRYDWKTLHAKLPRNYCGLVPTAASTSDIGPNINFFMMCR